MLIVFFNQTDLYCYAISWAYFIAEPTKRTQSWIFMASTASAVGIASWIDNHQHASIYPFSMHNNCSCWDHRCREFLWSTASAVRIASWIDNHGQSSICPFSMLTLSLSRCSGFLWSRPHAAGLTSWIDNCVEGELILHWSWKARNDALTQYYFFSFVPILLKKKNIF